MRTELARISWLGVNSILAAISSLTLNEVATVITMISGIIFAGYMLAKWYQQYLETKKFKKDNEGL